MKKSFLEKEAITVIKMKLADTTVPVNDIRDFAREILAFKGAHTDTYHILQLTEKYPDFTKNLKKALVDEADGEDKSKIEEMKKIIMFISSNN